MVFKLSFKLYVGDQQFITFLYYNRFCPVCDLLGTICNGTIVGLSRFKWAFEKACS